MRHLILFVLVAACYATTFRIVNDQYILGDKPFRLISGAFHYWRVHPDYWTDIIRKMANAGLNTIETYVAWNLHEPEKGKFNFQGFADLERFIDICAKHDLYVILRPGPYVCAEHEFGGLPYWLLKEENIKLRTKDPKYLVPALDFLRVLYGRMAKHMINRGGNIIMVQLENEYGSYPACDKEYLMALYNSIVDGLGDPSTYVIFTTDGPTDQMLTCGTLRPQAYATVDFGTGDPTDSWKMMRKYQPKGPLQNSEFYSGWLDHWGEKHQRIGHKALVESMDMMYNKFDGHFNFYMFIGGTNFAFLSGANGGGKDHSPQPTSYDYDAPLSEAGDMTYKYEMIRKKISEWKKVKQYEVFNHTKANYGPVSFTESASLFDNLIELDPSPLVNAQPLTFEALGLDYGFVMYRHFVKRAGTVLRLENVHDRAQVYVSRAYKGLITRQNIAETVTVNVKVGDTIDILVENQGRLNYGGQFLDRKGILGHVYVDDMPLEKFTMWRIGMKDLSKLMWLKTSSKSGPRFYRTKFAISSQMDTFVNPTGWNKGNIFMNGFNLGRYWKVGPQLTVYCPAPVLKTGINEMIVFETLETTATVMTLDDKPQIDSIKSSDRCYNE